LSIANYLFWRYAQNYVRLLSDERQVKEIGRLSGMTEEQKINASSETAEEFAGGFDAQRHN
jgi:hypothetical protein